MPASTSTVAAQRVHYLIDQAPRNLRERYRYMSTIVAHANAALRDVEVDLHIAVVGDGNCPNRGCRYHRP